MSYDYNFMGPDSPVLQQVPLLFDNTKNSGRRKLAQRVVTLLMKDTASSLGAFTGTSLMDTFGQGNVQNNSELNNRLNLAAASVVDYMRYNEDPTLPLDEQIKGLSLSAQNTGKGSVTVTARVTSKSGETTTVATTA